MAALALLGVVIGMIAAFLATRKKRNFKKRLLSDLERHISDGSARDYVFWASENKAQWEKPLSTIRKPFRDEVNLIIETAAFILALLGLITSLVNFDRVFTNTREGFSVVVFLGVVLAFIPCERFLNSRIEAEIDVILNELKSAARKGNVEAYFADAKRNWS